MTQLNARDTALLGILSSDHNRALILSALADSEKHVSTSTKAGVVASLRAALSMTIRYTSSADSLTVLDSLTGLTWQQEGSLKSMNADAADAYVASLNESSFGGHADWRMPNDHELLSIVDRARRSPAIDPVFSAKPEWYWTSTPLVTSDGASSPDRVWIVSFHNGLVDGYHRDSNAFVRAVRGPSPAGQ